MKYGCGRDTVERFLIDREKQYMRERRGPEALWTATVRKAWADAFYDITPKSGSQSKCAPKQIKQEAIHFLTGVDGWKEHREHCCDCAEISPEWIKNVAEKALVDGPPQPLPPAPYSGDLERDDYQTVFTKWRKLAHMEKKAKKTGDECMALVQEGA